MHLCIAFLQWSFNAAKFPKGLNRDEKMSRIMSTSTHSKCMIVMVLILVSAMAQMVSAETAQTWYLTGEPAGAPTANDGIDSHTKDALLNKSEGIGTWAGTRVDLPPDNVAWFYADTGAKCDLGFGENSWTAYIRTEEIKIDDEAGTHLKVSICKLDGAGSVTILAEGTKELTVTDAAYTLWEVDCMDMAGPQDFNAEDWLAVRLWWTDAPGGKNLRIYYKAETDRDSYITSPPSDPGYPVPELPTLVLFSAGLLILAGYAYMGRRNK